MDKKVTPGNDELIIARPQQRAEFKRFKTNSCNIASIFYLQSVIYLPMWQEFIIMDYSLSTMSHINLHQTESQAHNFVVTEEGSYNSLP